MLTGLMKHTADGPIIKVEMDPYTFELIQNVIVHSYDIFDFETACELCDIERTLLKIRKGESNGTE